MVKQDWFELKEQRRKKYNNQVWIPLRAAKNFIKEGKYGYTGYCDDFWALGSLAFPIQNKNEAEKLSWSDIGISHSHSGYAEEGKYTPADTYVGYPYNITGVHLVLEQEGCCEFTREWHLHQDLIITLGLFREGDSWIRPNDGYVEVARLERDSTGKAVLIEIKAQYLKDYLCARNMGLYITAYNQRDFITEDPGFITWNDENDTHQTALTRWERRVIPIHEGGEQYGAKAAIMHIARTDPVDEDDIPNLSEPPTEDNVTHSSWEKHFDGRKLYRIMGEYWHNEWIPPAKMSPIVRWDEQEPTVFFITEADGTKLNGQQLTYSGKWLWFKPTIISAIANRRGGHLEFYTHDTGKLTVVNYGIHFGVNKLGLINAYAEDIGSLPEWLQQIWAGHNILPEGGVSTELLDSQVRAEPANTKAPEAYLHKGILLANEHCSDNLGFLLFKEHEAVPELLSQIHRFRAVNEIGLFSLAKDLVRLTVEPLDAKAIQRIVPPPKKTQWGSLKSLTNLLTAKLPEDTARAITAPLVGVYELRHADSHLPSKDLKEAYQLIGIDPSTPHLEQAVTMLHNCVSSIWKLADIFSKWQQLEHN